MVLSRATVLMTRTTLRVCSNVSAQFLNDKDKMSFTGLLIAATKPPNAMDSDDASEDHSRQAQPYPFYVLVKEDFVSKAMNEDLSKFSLTNHAMLLPKLKELSRFLLANQAGE